MEQRLSKSEMSRNRVLDAAAKIFRDYGYAATTMRAIADEAELKAGSIYYHYKSKDELIAAVLERGLRTVIDNVRGALALLPPDATKRQRIETAITAHLTAIIEKGDYTLATRRVFGQVPASVRNQNIKLRDSYATLWQSLLTEAYEAGEFRSPLNPSIARLFLLGALNSVVDWFKPSGRAVEDVARDFVALAMDGLAGSPAGKEPG